MPESFQFGRLRAEDSSVFLNTGRLIGLQSIEINSQFGLSPLLYISQGSKRTFNISNSEQYADVSINSLLINQDNFISLTGKEPINLYILKDKNDLNNNNYFLISGYLNSYNASYTIGQIPQISAGLRFYNNAGKINTGELNALSVSQLTGIAGTNYQYLDTGKIPFFGSVNLTTDDGINNRLNAFSVQIQINRVPIYNIGNRFPRRLDIQFPIDANISITMEASQLYSGTQLRDLPRGSQEQNIRITINDYSGNLPISSYNFNNSTLINETKAINVDGNEIVTKQYNCKMPSLPQQPFTITQILTSISISKSPYNPYDFQLDESTTNVGPWSVVKTILGHLTNFGDGTTDLYYSARGRAADGTDLFGRSNVIQSH